MTTTLPIDSYQRTSTMLASSWWIYGTLWLSPARQRLSTDEPSSRDAGSVPDQTQQGEDR